MTDSSTIVLTTCCLEHSGLLALHCRIGTSLHKSRATCHQRDWSLQSPRKAQIFSRVNHVSWFPFTELESSMLELPDCPNFCQLVHQFKLPTFTQLPHDFFLNRHDTENTVQSHKQRCWSESWTQSGILLRLPRTSPAAPENGESPRHMKPPG